MKNSKSKASLIWLLLIIGMCFIVGYNLIRQRKEVSEEIIEKEGIYRIGNVSVDTRKGQIRLSGKVFIDEGWVQHLVYLEGYKWLREESAIIADAKLANLQKVIALLDWRLWDELWYKKVKSEKSKVKGQGLAVSVKWDEEEIAARKLVLTEDKLEIGDFIFLGSPYFDHIALEAPPGVNCRLCPLFPLEEKALKEEFRRESGESGYELNSPLFPPKGTEVTIIIRGANQER